MLGPTRLLRLRTDGTSAEVAGRQSVDLENVPLAEANLEHVASLEFGPDGLLYIAERGANRIRRVDPDGIVRRVVGGGDCARPDKPGPGGINIRDVGDGGPAAQACLPDAQDIAFAGDGTMYFSDSTIETLRTVGSGMPGFQAEDIAIPSSDGTELYRFDATGQHMETVNALTGATLLDFDYDGAGRLALIRDGDDNETEIERDGSGHAEAIVGPYGARTELTIRSDGWLGAVTDPAAATHALDYAAGGLLTEFERPGGFASTFAYEPDGRLREDSSPDGETKTLARTETLQGQQVTVTTALGRVRTHSLQTGDDGAAHRSVAQPTGATTEAIRGRGTTTVTHADGTISTLIEGGDPRWGTQAPVAMTATVTTPGGLRAESTIQRTAQLATPSQPLSLTTLEEKVTANGHTTTGTYTASTRTFTLESPLERAFTIQTDTLGRPLTTTLPGITITTYDYDNRGRLQTSTQGTRTWTYDYDADGNLASVEGPEGYEREYEYDAVGRLTTTTLPDGREIAFDYDGAGRLESITPPQRPSHAFDYTDGGKAKQYNPPASAEHVDVAEAYSYDDDGRLETVERPGGHTVTYGYDTAGRLETVEAGGETLALDYQATGARKLGELTAPGGQQQNFTYDGPLLTSEQWSGPIAGEVAYDYDDDLRLTATEVNGASRAALDYDDDGLLVAAGDLTISRRNDNGAVSATTLGEITSTQSASAYGELDTLSYTDGVATLLDLNVERDGLGRITAKTETTNGTTHEYEYGYDSRGRLTEVTRDEDPWRSYAYDANGNRTQDTTGSATAVEADYDDQDRLTERGSTDYHYTAAGELAQRIDLAGTTSFEHDAFGQLRSVELPDETEIDYVLDGNGRRVGKKIDGTLVQRYLYGDGLGPIAELAGDVSVASRYVYGTAGHVPDYLIRAGHTYRLITDNQGSVRVVVDTATGDLAQELDYDPYGRVLRDTSPGFQPFSWAGGIRDADTGLIRFGARDYDPETGRWTSKDPIGFNAGDTNLYGYVLNDPVNLIDPTGLSAGMAISELSAGILDSLTFGAGSAIAGVEICSDAYKLGELLGDLNPKGALKRAGKTTIAAAVSKDVTRVRHYTNMSRAKRIEQDGVIKADDQGCVFCESASRKPLSPRDAEAKYGIGRGRGQAYVETDVPSSSVSSRFNPLTRADEMLIRGDVPLSPNARIVRRP